MYRYRAPCIKPCALRSSAIFSRLRKFQNPGGTFGTDSSSRRSSLAGFAIRLLIFVPCVFNVWITCIHRVERCLAWKYLFTNCQVLSRRFELTNALLKLALAYGTGTYIQGCGSGSAFIFPPGSGSRRKNFPHENRKSARKLKITKFIKFLKYIFTSSNVSFFLSILYVF